MTTLAGTGHAAYSGDGGPATAATLHWPHGLAVDPAGAALYIADSANHRLRRVDLASGVITTVAGGAAPGFGGDGGPAVGAPLQDPKAVWAAPSGDVYIADSGNERIRRIDPSGTISTVAGTGVPGYSGDGGPAIAAQFDGPRGLAGDGAGNLYVADDNNNRIRRIDTSGVVTTVAGTGAAGFSGDGGPARSAQLEEPPRRGGGPPGKRVHRRQHERPHPDGRPGRDDLDRGRLRPARLRGRWRPGHRRPDVRAAGCGRQRRRPPLRGRHLQRPGPPGGGSPPRLAVLQVPYLARRTRVLGTVSRRRDRRRRR